VSFITATGANPCFNRCLQPKADNDPLFNKGGLRVDTGPGRTVPWPRASAIRLHCPRWTAVPPADWFD
jgi:hypothetical protein